MSETLTLPVLPLDDEVVLPGMVVPIELSDQEVRGAIDAARTKGLGQGTRRSFGRREGTGAAGAEAR